LARPCDLSQFFTPSFRVSKLAGMAVHLKSETESRLRELAATTGRAPEELVEDAVAGYLAELAQVRNMLPGRYDDIKSDRVEPIDGEEAFDFCAARVKIAAIYERICPPPRGLQRSRRNLGIHRNG
jgi:hypothetical protein